MAVICVCIEIYMTYIAQNPQTRHGRLRVIFAPLLLYIFIDTATAIA